MKTKIMFLALAFFAGANVASAEMTMNPSQHPVYSDPAKGAVVIIGYISNIDWDAAQAAKTSRDSQKLPVIGGGVDLVDEGGVVYKNACSQEFVSRHQCVVLTGTQKYRDSMISMARTVIANGMQSQFPHLNGWFNLAK